MSRGEVAPPSTTTERHRFGTNFARFQKLESDGTATLKQRCRLLPGAASFLCAGASLHASPFSSVAGLQRCSSPCSPAGRALLDATHLLALRRTRPILYPLRDEDSLVRGDDRGVSRYEINAGGSGTAEAYKFRRGRRTARRARSEETPGTVGGGRRQRPWSMCLVPPKD